MYWETALHMHAARLLHWSIWNKMAVDCHFIKLLQFDSCLKCVSALVSTVFKRSLIFHRLKNVNGGRYHKNDTNKITTVNLGSAWECWDWFNIQHQCLLSVLACKPNSKFIQKKHNSDKFPGSTAATKNWSLTCQDILHNITVILTSLKIKL